MGTWSLERLTTHSSDLNGPVYGTNYHAVFHLKYTSTTFGQFTETPRLDWHERILMNEYHNNQSWVFETNMYEHNPCSQTLLVWARRSIECYRKAAHIGPGVQKGSAVLQKLNGGTVTAADLGAGLTDGASQATAVRNYLKSHGGLMTIEIHDVPGINTPTGAQRKERLLLFDVGLVGGGLRSRAEQYLDVTGGQPAGTWRREFNCRSWARNTLAHGAMAVVPAPALVSNPRRPLFAAGECW